MTEVTEGRGLMHVIAGFDTGGTEMMTLRLVRHWSAAFPQRVVALGQERGPLRAAFEEALPAGVEALGLERFGGLDAFRAWETTFRVDKPDAVLMNCFGRHHLVVGFAARRARVRAVGAWAGNPPPSQILARAPWALVVAGSRRLGCPIVTCSEAVMSAFGRLGVTMPAGSCVIPNGVNIEEIASRAASARRRRVTNGPVIGMVARLDAIKDHLTLIRAIALLRLVVPNVTLWIIGDGSSRLALEAEVARLGTRETVRFFGRRTDIPEILGEMDLYAFSTTRDEGFGIALIEAMAASVPIVATDVAACREVLGDGATGILVPPAEPTALAEALRRLIDEHGHATHLAEAALRRARAEYAVAACASRWEAVLGLHDGGKRRENCGSEGDAE